MAEGIASGQADAILDALLRSVAYSDPAAVYIQLHTGAPGAAGTSNIATETTRKLASFSAASGGAITTDAALTWASVAGTETISHWSAWSASSSGTFLCSDALDAPRSVTAGDTFQMNAGDIDITLGTIAS